MERHVIFLEWEYWNSVCNFLITTNTNQNPKEVFRIRPNDFKFICNNTYLRIAKKTILNNHSEGRFALLFVNLLLKHSNQIGSMMLTQESTDKRNGTETLNMSECVFIHTQLIHDLRYISNSLGKRRFSWFHKSYQHNGLFISRRTKLT